MKACIFGAPLEVGNRGVLALGVSVAELLAHSSPGIEIFFHHGSGSGGTRRLGRSGEDVVVTVLNCRMSPRSRPAEHILVILGLALLYRLGVRGPAGRNAWLRALLEADFIGEIRGGDSFSDIYGFRRFFLRNLPLISVVLLRRPYVMLPQTYGPFRASASRRLAKFMLRCADTLFTRDRSCESPVFDLCGRTPRFCPDVAFTLEPLEPRDLRLSPPGLDLDGDGLLVGVNVSGLLYTGGYTGRNMFGLRSDYAGLIERLIDAILTSTPARILLVPHVFGSEHEEEACALVAARIQERHPGRVFALTQPLSEREVKWVIGKTEFFVGARMHACIAALSQYVPTVGLAYSDKFLGVFESAGVGDSIIDLRNVQDADVIARTLSALEGRVEIRARLQSQIPAVQDAVRQTFRELVRDRSSRPQPAREECKSYSTPAVG